MPLQKTRVYGYPRVSGKSQLGGHGPERQRELMLEFAAANNLEIVGWFQESHTGTESTRPMFMDMLARMVEGDVKTILVESLDRFARDVMVQCTLLAKLVSLDLTLIAANTGENVTAAMSQDPMRKAMVQIQAVFAELDKSLLVQKLAKGKAAMRAKTGRCEGQKPFGWYAGEQETLDRIKRLRRKDKNRFGQRLPWQEVADRLNAEGFSTRTGVPWTPGNVRGVMRTAAIKRLKSHG